jgi:uncharacterized protein
LRLVLDTNIVVAALLWAGPPQRLLARAIDDETLTLYSTPTLIDELGHTLRYPKFAQRIARYATTPAALVAQYTDLVTLLSPLHVPRVIEQDADDDHVIAAAIAARADILVSGDHDILDLGTFRSVRILAAGDALSQIDNIAR